MLSVPVEDKRLIVSVPSALHSQKPLLSEVLKSYIGAEAKCLELFARNLQPGWTSWGNEVLKFQHISYFNLDPVDISKAEAAKDEMYNPAVTCDFSSPKKTDCLHPAFLTVEQQ
ncbi:hypothetical protein XENOCAPTIV_003006 [Xenoophorus captivus]|uniref:Uncharacterized protein n=1 Tax=Xenoophorus captivus TaxID=1517983 RepID=A0ABV0SBK9_9TELE